MVKRSVVKIDNFREDKGFREKLTGWAKQFQTFVFLDNNRSQNPFNLRSFEFILAADPIEIISENSGAALNTFQQVINKNPDWYFGYFGYDLKSEIAGLRSKNPDNLKFPDLFFFRPKHLITLDHSGILKVESTDDPEKLLHEINAFHPDSFSQNEFIELQSRVTEKEYLDKIKTIRNLIAEGDVYELNYCIEFFAENVTVDPYSLWMKLRSRSAAPFSSLFKHDKQFLISSSPERFIRKEGNKIFSQPIKGTGKRGLTEEEDKQNISDLKNCLKERAENVMITDLVRNDLARSCKTGTVKVDELFGIYTFPQVHQMISTISGNLREQISISEIIRNTFPMGSMTGAPKKIAMEIIDDLEITKRGLYSGALGYITPENNFDFNVVIRSLIYNADNSYLSCQVGSAITYDSIPENEYEECLLKAKAIREVLGSTQVCG